MCIRRRLITAPAASLYRVTPFSLIKLHFLLCQGEREKRKNKFLRASLESRAFGKNRYLSSDSCHDN